MMERDHRIPSDAVVQGSPRTKDGIVREDGDITTAPWENNWALEDSGNKGVKEKPVRSLNEASAEQKGDEKGEKRERQAARALKSAKESPVPSPRLPFGKMKWSQSEQQKPVPSKSSQPDGEFQADTGAFPKEAVETDRESSPRREIPRPEQERELDQEPFRKETKKSPRGRKIPAGVLKWRKDEETDEVGKGKFPGKAKFLRLSEFLPGKAEKSGKEVSNAQRRLRKAVKVLWVPSLLFGSILVGLLIGYAGLGDRSPTEVFDLDVWKHIYQMVYG